MTAPLKTQARDDSVEEFIASWPNDQAEEGKLLCELLQNATGQKPKRWGTKLIGFGTYTYRYSSGRTGDWMPIAFAPRKGGMTLYLVDGQDHYKERLSTMTVKGGEDPCLLAQRAFRLLAYATISQVSRNPLT